MGLNLLFLGLMGLNRLGLVGRALVFGLLSASRLSGGGAVAGRIGRNLAVAVSTDAGKLEDHVHDVCLAGFGFWASAHGPCDDLKLRRSFR